MKTTTKQILGEFFASLLLSYFGLSVVVSMVVYGSVTGVMEFGIAFSLIIACIIIIFNPISGAHFNPAVTLSMAVWMGFPKKMVLPYWIVQILGWFTGALLLYVTFGADITAYEVANGIVRGSAESAGTAGIFICNTRIPWVGIFAEIMMTGFLVIIVLACCDPKNGNRPTAALFPWAIGFSVGFLVMFGATLTGTALNPARDFGPRLAIWLLGWGEVAFPGKWFVYWIGPLLGGILGGGFYNRFITKLITTVDPTYKVTEPDTDDIDFNEKEMSKSAN